MLYDFKEFYGKIHEAEIDKQKKAMITASPKRGGK